jgi:hypothetical protein
LAESVWSFALSLHRRGPEDKSETEGAGDDRPPYMDVEPKPVFASRDIEIEAAVAEMQVPRWIKGVVDRPEHLPIGVRADAKAADIAVAGETLTIAEIAVITRADQRIGPAAAGRHRHTRKQTRVERHPRRKSPSTKAKAGIRELYRVFEEAVERDSGALIRLQRGVATLKKDVVRRDFGAHGQVNGVGEKAEGAVADLERPHERRPLEMRKQIDGADIGIHLGLARQRRQCRGMDAREPKIRRDEELVAAGGRHILR